MSNIDVYLVVEGQTEQTFVRDVLAPKMGQMGIYLYPALLGKPGHKGGDVRFDRAKNDIGNFLKQRDDIFVSTMFDYAFIDGNWPGRTSIRRQTEGGTTLPASQKAELLEEATLEEIFIAFPDCNVKKRFIPYIEMHEFEALLFSDANVLAEITGIDPARINKILEDYNNPEEINDDPAGAPSKRLIALRSSYRKVAMGKMVTDAIGINRIRERCPHFNSWLTKLENLAREAPGEV